MIRTNLLPFLLFGAFTYGQVGINTPTPHATLDVKAKNTDGSSSEGIIVPKLTGDALFSAIAANRYGADQDGAVVYITEAAAVANQTGQTVLVNDYGFYYFNGSQNQWMKLGSGSTIYRTDGTLTGPRHMTMDGNNLGFTGGRIGMGTASPDPSALLDLTSTGDGFLPPRMTKAQMDAIFHPATGLMIYCTDCFGDLGCIMVNDSKDPLVTNWGSMCTTNVPTGHVDDLQCLGAVTSGGVHSGMAASGVTTTIPYTGGNGGTYFSGAFNSTGVTGLTANVDGGSLSQGNGNLLFTITGTPSAVGTASFAITVAGKSCSFTVDVDNFTASVASLTCSSAVFAPNSMIQGEVYTGTLTVPYTGGNGDSYSQMSFTQNGLTFTLPAGTLATGAGNLVYNVTGTPTNAITMNLPISFGSQSCNVSKVVSPSGSGVGTTMCMGNGTKVWASHNLGADTSLDPHVPVKEIYGNFYQWGRLEVVANTDTPPGPISGWNTTAASNGAWNLGTEDAPVKTAIDPCPSGFRLPTRKEWVALVNNTSSNTIGTFNGLYTDFDSARQFICAANGNKLTLPVAGYRNYSSSAPYAHNNQGYYWSSTENAAGYAYDIFFSKSNIDPANVARRAQGSSVRCIAE
ncbi:hypothetical protein D1632_14015 [Chryseobacterium nematophagum]|uniref:Fibrobacter succinogenes major paralogous domain-containing protein n=1 Tax=Chryseobacterium nematophagum TaxID=2305228 RepID=A0A3M7LAZ6_9FLAO|nr:FISUMP domain-containing protein [Chryseobacterium nematophagum]RMZ58702.1 hypothetical protein D1632_14015 [Chryseobacterium nematophagum]